MFKTKLYDYKSQASLYTLFEIYATDKPTDPNQIIDNKVNLLNIHNLTVSFQGDDLFSGITFQLRSGDRVGLVGKNGAGKSTLLKILSGEQEYDKGQIASDKEISIGFLKQDIDFVKGRTVLEEAYEAFKLIKELDKRHTIKNNHLVDLLQYHQLLQELTSSNG